MSVTPEQAQTVLEQADCLYTRQQVEDALDRVAEAVTERLGKCNPLVLCVMTGALMPTAYLLSRLRFPLQLDYIHATRYGNKTSGGELHWITRPQYPLQDRDVLIVDDILDEGPTLAAIVAECRKQGAKSVHTAVMVEKEHDRKAADIKADFVGLPVEDRYVFGYGMDYKNYWRNIDGIYAVKGS